MKTSLIFIFTLLLVGCASTRQSSSLTTEQATTIAQRFANDKAFTLYHCQPFRGNQQAQFMAGHWVWLEERSIGHEDIQARVELAANGSAQKVEVELLDSQLILSFMSSSPSGR